MIIERNVVIGYDKLAGKAVKQFLEDVKSHPPEAAAEILTEEGNYKTVPRKFTHIYFGNSGDLKREFYDGQSILSIYKNKRGKHFNVTVYLSDSPITDHLKEEFSSRLVNVGTPRIANIQTLSEWAGLPIEYLDIINEIDIRTKGARAEIPEAKIKNWPSKGLEELASMLNTKIMEWRESGLKVISS